MDASNPASAPSKTYDIARHGDIILVVGEKETQLRVHSACMRTASKVFDAMFGPHFLEVNYLTETIPERFSCRTTMPQL